LFTTAVFTENRILSTKESCLIALAPLKIDEVSILILDMNLSAAVLASGFLREEGLKGDKDTLDVLIQHDPIPSFCPGVPDPGAFQISLGPAQYQFHLLSVKRQRMVPVSTQPSQSV
jgi:hypothetical protein